MYVYIYIYSIQIHYKSHICVDHLTQNHVSFFFFNGRVVPQPGFTAGDVKPPPVVFENRLSGNIFQKLEKVQGALEMCQKALNDFMVSWIFNQGGF